jgi:hypothetical protein
MPSEGGAHVAIYFTRTNVLHDGQRFPPGVRFTCSDPDVIAELLRVKAIGTPQRIAADRKRKAADEQRKQQQIEAIQARRAAEHAERAEWHERSNAQNVIDALADLAKIESKIKPPQHLDEQ